MLAGAENSGGIEKMLESILGISQQIAMQQPTQAHHRKGAHEEHINSRLHDC